VYALPPLLGRALSFLLTPVFTQVMTPAEFGDASLALALGPALSLCMTFGVHLSINRLHHRFDSADERRRFYGTVISFMVVVPCAITLALHAIGAAGYLELFDALPFDSHLWLVLWMAYFMSFGNLPVSMHAVREEPVRSAFYATLSPVLMAGFGIVLVVVMGRGAVGYIEAGVWSAAIPAAIGIVAGFWMYPPRWSWRHLREALAFGVPLVPHLASVWALGLANRVVLEAHVTRDLLGIFSLAASFAMLVGIAAQSIDRAFVPMLNRKLAAGDAKDVPRLGTVALATKTWAGVVVALTAGDVVRLVTPPSYHGASDYVAPLVLGMLFQNFGQLWVQGIFFARKTHQVPVATFIAAALNIGLCLALVPLLGAWAAVIGSVAGYAAQTGVYAWFAKRGEPIAWEYGKWVRIFLCALALYALWLFVPADLPIALRLAIAAAIALAGYPLVLVGTGTVRVATLKRLRSR
jgi:O-antigen/teichoic acid export membrane protein